MDFSFHIYIGEGLEDKCQNPTVIVDEIAGVKSDKGQETNIRLPKMLRKIFSSSILTYTEEILQNTELVYLKDHIPRKSYYIDTYLVFSVLLKFGQKNL